MKKSLVALAALAAIGAASAQSTVTLYGVVDVNVTSTKQRGTSLTTLDSGGLNGSRWGLRGTEDLGGGLKGIFRLESGFTPDDGLMGQGGRLFGRHATVGLEGGFGSVRLGRTLTPIGVLGDESATLGSKGLDLLAVAGMVSVNAAYRTDNAITYDSPNFGGLTASAQYSTQLNGQETSNHNGRHAGFNVIYKGGPLQAGIGYLDQKVVVATGNSDVRAILGNIGYNFGVAAVKAVVERDEINTSEDPTFLGLEASVPLGAFTLSAGIARLRDATGAAGVSDDANLYTLQGVYNLSKRTALYTFFTQVKNKGASNRGFGARIAAQPIAATATTPATTLAGTSNRALQIGVRHSF
jgi:predicted porin